MVAVSDFSGLASSICALARAPAIAPIDSLERCMTDLRHLEIKADGARLGSLGPNAVPNRFLGILRHEFLQLNFRCFMIEESCAGLTKHAGKFRPGIG